MLKGNQRNELCPCSSGKKYKKCGYKNNESCLKKNKFCVFCGKKEIIDKTIEHVIPQWLITLTGNPKREVNLGVDWNKSIITKALIHRKYSFDNFAFPACSYCNNEFSELEGKVNKIFLKILGEGKISESDFSLLLDWFDKVRIGLWLGLMQLNKNRHGIRPNFYIKNRIGKHDRALFIFKIKNIKDKGLNFAGTELECFSLCPSFFGLRVNNFFFINTSSPLLFWENLGLPYVDKKNIKYDTTKQRIGIEKKLNKGKKKVFYPIIKGSNIFDSATQIYQPIMIEEILKDSEKNYQDIYSKDFFNFKKDLKGFIFINSDKNLIKYPVGENNSWVPKNDIDSKEVLPIFAENYKILENIILDSGFDNLSFADKNDVKMRKDYLSAFEFDRKILMRN